MKIQGHHIEYKSIKHTKDWVVDIPAYMHKAISIMQRTKTTEERYAIFTGVMHAF